MITNAIDQGCGNGQKPKRLEGEEVSFLRPIFRLAHLSFPAVELFVSHFGDDSAQATRAFVACRELEQRCRSICVALAQHFPELQCKSLEALTGPRG